MALPAHTRTWQFQVNQGGAPGTAPAPARALMIGVVGGLLGRGSWVDKDNASVASAGNWTVKSSSNGAGTFGNNDDVNNLDTTGVLDPTKFVWAATGSNHTWVVLQQTGIAAKYQVCIDLNSATTSTATIVVSFGAGFGAANGGADGTATARPTATDQQILVNGTDWGGSTTLGTIWHVMKSSDGKAFRMFAMRSEACVLFADFEVPDPVPAAWTDPSIAHWVGHNTATEQLNYARLTGANTQSRTGATTFASSWVIQGSQTNTNIPNAQGHINEVDGTTTFRQIAINSVVVNARGINGKIPDVFWANDSGSINVGSLSGQSAPAGPVSGIQWARFGAIWVPWPKNNLPRVVL